MNGSFRYVRKFIIHRKTVSKFHEQRLFSFNCFQKRTFSVNTNPLEMRFVQFKSVAGGPQRLGVQLSLDGDIVDVSAVDSCIPNNLVEFLRGGERFIERAKRIVADGKSITPLSQVELLSPVIGPDKVVCVGLNYTGHCEEQNLSKPQEPCIFNKFPCVIVGPYCDVIHPSNTKALDWEVELAVVIGKTAKEVLRKDALDYVFGYTVAQDITARDWMKNRNNGQWLLGKSMDTFCPLGPAVVMKEYVSDPHNLAISCSVNGEVKQNATTSELIFRVDDIIAYVSHFVTLLPGDIILTGTPAGVGVFRNPREFLKPGDVIESEIAQIGKLRNTVVQKN
ncbi:oxaloacetate tautomerase Fahd2a, mitochondrial [Lycorma delicatula]|uniref:oxaloacetate tautomerase Fahd2a, mitochondrial n=1 Tax=Lycorma delicatula TaxID=130591 RepID=UPI003F5186A1